MPRSPNFLNENLFAIVWAYRRIFQGREPGRMEYLKFLGHSIKELEDIPEGSELILCSASSSDSDSSTEVIPEPPPICTIAKTVNAPKSAEKRKFDPRDGSVLREPQ